jgi:CDP-diacylglycerol--glycerol-3-phosphate 3-phosphatidyltransferase
VANLKTRYTDGARRGFFRIGVVLAHRGFTADMMTIIGVLLQVAALPLIITGHFIWALVIGIIASLCDALDGAVARAGAGPTTAGAFLDSTLDRVSELMVSAALVVYFVREGPEWGPIVAVLVFMGSAQMVSYVRARAEALGVDCKVGFMSRPERLVGLGIGFLFSWWQPGGTSFLVWMLYLLAVITVITVVHRELHVLHKLRAMDQPAALEAPPPAAGDGEAGSGGFAGDDFAGDDLWAEPGRHSGRRY